MRCVRCQGLMVVRRIRVLLMWNCLNCGECVDDTIRFNRAMAKPETEAQRNERIWRRVQHEMQLQEVGC